MAKKTVKAWILYGVKIATFEIWAQKGVSILKRSKSCTKVFVYVVMVSVYWLGFQEYGWVVIELVAMNVGCSDPTVADLPVLFQCWQPDCM